MGIEKRMEGDGNGLVVGVFGVKEGRWDSRYQYVRYPGPLKKA